MRTENAEVQYRNVIAAILSEGQWEQNRTGIDTIKLPYPAVIRAHMDDGFPALTGRRVPFKSAMGELCGFLRGVTSAAQFRALGCGFWDQNANTNVQWLTNAFRKGTDDLGDVYGAQWRRWPAYKRIAAKDLTKPVVDALRADGWRWVADSTSGQPAGGAQEYNVVFYKEVDQLAECVRKILTNPNDRRILFHAWNPAKLDEIALPACHLLYQFVPTPSKKELALSISIRSNDLPLGWPSNIMEGAALLQLVAQLTGYKPTWLTVISNDAHIYANQMEMVSEYLERPLHPFPTLSMPKVPAHAEIAQRAYKELSEQHPSVSEDDYQKLVAERTIEWLDLVDPADFVLTDYKHGSAISAAMAV